MKYKKWTEKDYQYLIENYSTMNNNILCKNLKCTKRALLHKTNKLRLKKKKNYIINQTFFDDWSSDMAYILGFIITDGCISDDNRLSFGVALKDKCILDYIGSKLVPGKEIKISTEYRKGVGHLTARLKFTSQYIAKKLREFHIVPRKTGIEILPECPDKFKGDLLRGIFDGDGCINISNKKYRHLKYSICSASKSFLETIKQKLGLYLGYIRQKNETISSWYIYKQKDIKIIRDIMYKKDNIFCLERKKRIFYGE